MTDSARASIYQAIASIRLIDPHTHINPHAPASNTLADLLGYHYYTELAHSAGMPKDQIEQRGLSPRELVQRLISNLSAIENTAQYRWLIEICRMFFGFDGDRIDRNNWQEVYDAAERQMRLAEWPQMVLDQSNVEAVFLTNDFDDELTGFDTDTFIPCLRTDDLVFQLRKPQTRDRLAACTGIELDGSLLSLRESLRQRFEHFVGSGARACAISLPPTFEPTQVSDGRAATALDEVLRKGHLADEAHQTALSRRVFWTLAELCDEYGLPFDLMIGVNRGVYAGGVYQGQDLYDSRVSLIQYRELFNSFPTVKFPISVLASVTNQELVSYAWIFPNVITNGHWWYSNTPSFIARDAAARLEAVPQTKQIGYYSDAYKLEFVWPKFDMYRRVLAGILADHFVKGCGWSEDRAIELGRQVLRENVDAIFPRPAKRDASPQAESLADTWTEASLDDNAPALPEATWVEPAVAGTSAALAAGAIGMVEVNHAADLSTLDPADINALEVEQADFAEGADQENSGFSTVVSETEPSSAGGVDNSTLEETIELIDESDDVRAAGETVRIETVIEELGGHETIRAEEPSSDIADDWAQDLPDLPTMLDLGDSDSSDLTAADQGTGQFGEPAAELDPLPSAEEIQAVDVSDVEFRDLSAELATLDADSIEAEAEPEPLDVGDLFDEEAAAQPDEGIRMFRGESSFEPDEESLQLQPDPVTGELTFPVPSPPVPSPGAEATPIAEIDDESWPDEQLFLEMIEDADRDLDNLDDANLGDELIELDDGQFDPSDDRPSKSPDDQSDADGFIEL